MSYKRLITCTVNMTVHVVCLVTAFYCIYSVSQKKTSPTFLAVTLESIVGFS